MPCVAIIVSKMNSKKKTMPCVAPTFIIAFANCINPSPSTALNGLTSDTTNATELFNTVSFITFDKLMSDLLKYAIILGDNFALYKKIFASF